MTVDELMTIDEFCELTRITDRTLRKLRARGDAPPEIRVGRRVLMRREAVRFWLRSRETTQVAA